MPEISVIVPIYKVEKSLRKCLESLVNQTNQEIEIILVNDGSPDKSGEIAKEYNLKFGNKVFYYEKENGGLSDARNFGLKKARGKYIAFVDSDDYINVNLFKKLEKYIKEDYDLVKFKITTVDLEDNTVNVNKSPVFENKTGEEAYELLYKEDKLTDVAWSYIYKKEFWDKNKFEYPVGAYHEDFALTSLIILKAKKVASTDIDGYYYVQSENSITRGNPETQFKRNMDLISHYDTMIEKIENYNISKTSKENIKIYYTNAIILALDNLKDKAQRKAYIKQIKQRKMVKNIKVRNLKQFMKKSILNININLYLKLKNKA